MKRKPDSVEGAPQESFPAKDPPAWTPVMGAGNPRPAYQVVTVGGQQVVHVENGRGEELCHHLASHGIVAKASTAAETNFDRVEIENKADADVIQTILDQWER